MDFGDTSAADGMVMAMLLIMLVALGMVGLLVWSIRKSGGKRDREVEALLDEVNAEEERVERSTPRRERELKVTAEPWEKDGDWWKS